MLCRLHRHERRCVEVALKEDGLRSIRSEFVNLAAVEIGRVKITAAIESQTSRGARVSGKRRFRPVGRKLQNVAGASFRYIEIAGVIQSNPSRGVERRDIGDA